MEISHIMVRCEKHPEYKADSKPDASCVTCKFLFLLVGSGGEMVARMKNIRGAVRDLQAGYVRRLEKLKR